MKRTRGTVNEETFNQVKELQRMGASAGKAGRFVGLSSSTTTRMFNNETFTKYKEFVTSISRNKARVTPNVPEALEQASNPINRGLNETQLLTKAINRLAIAVEENNSKKKSLW